MASVTQCKCAGIGYRNNGDGRSMGLLVTAPTTRPQPEPGATTTQVNRKEEQKMDQIFPQTIFVALAGSGDDAYLSISKTEIEAIMSTDDENQAMVAEYLLVSLRHRAISKTVVNAK